MLNGHNRTIARNHHSDVSGAICNSPQLVSVPSGGLRSEEVCDAAVSRSIDIPEGQYRLHDPGHDPPLLLAEGGVISQLELGD
ncbi:MAG: hypothetical protein EDM82_12690 [Cyanobacteria bacterium CYA]|nr:MAG: hypothetical protein EDM82_12690 [Cyanobacteria bacterium CYA]